MVEYKKLMDIEETKRIVVPNDTELSELRAKCCSLAQENGIYLEVTEDVVSSGGLFRAKNDPCLILNHPEHPNDYDRFCCMVTTDETRKYIELYKLGSSRLAEKLKSQGKISKLLHGNQYEIEFKAEQAFYDTIVKKIWEDL